MFQKPKCLESSNVCQTRWRAIKDIHIIMYQLYSQILLIMLVRLNLFSQVLALFRAKFACNLVIRYPVFRWDLCKGCVWESVKKTQDICNQRSLATRSRDWLITGKSPKWHMCEACRELKGHDSWSTTRQNVPLKYMLMERVKV